MGSKSKIVYGCGFYVKAGNDYAEKFQQFIKNHKKAFCQKGEDEDKKLYEELMKIPPSEIKWSDVEDIFEEYTGEIGTAEGYGNAIANILYRETGIEFQYEAGCADCGSNPAIVLAEQMPWVYNRKEKKITLEQFENLCNKYTNELYGENLFSHIEIEYYG